MWAVEDGMQGGANSKLQPLQTRNADANPKMLILQGFGMWDGNPWGAERREIIQNIRNVISMRLF